MSLSLKPEQLQSLLKYSSTFIETGTYMGGAAILAHRCGFTDVHTVELSPAIYEAAGPTLAAYPIKRYLGDTAQQLGIILKNHVSTRAVLYLDAHHMEGDQRSARGEQNAKWSLSPIRHEIEAIRVHDVNDHVVLIDDIDFFAKRELDFITMEEVKARLFEINPRYQFSIVNGARKNSLLIAAAA
jgi:hypothetical protein